MEQTERDRWGIVAVAGLAILVTMTDVGAVNVALPGFSDRLGHPPGVILWLVSGYLIPMTAVLVPVSRWLPEVGLRAALVLGLAGLAVADVAAAIGQDAGKPGLGFMIFARALAGPPAALLVMVAPRLPATAVRPERRAIAQSVTGFTGPLGLTVGALWGGSILSGGHWGALFWLVPPFALAVIALTFALVPAAGGLKAPKASGVLDAAVFAAAAVSLVLALAFPSPYGAAWFLALIPAALFTALWARRPTNTPLLPMFGGPRTRGPLLAMLLILVAGNSAQFVSPFLLRDFLHASWSQTARTVPALAVAMVVLAIASPTLTKRFSARQLSVSASVVVALGLASFATLPAQPSTTDLAWRLAVVGAGLGLFNGPHQMLVLKSLSAPTQIPAAIEASWVVRNLGFVYAPVAGAAVLDGGIPHVRGVFLAFAAAAVVGAAAQLGTRRAVAEPAAQQPVPTAASR
jgi:MFS family permease